MLRMHGDLLRALGLAAYLNDVTVYSRKQLALAWLFFLAGKEKKKDAAAVTCPWQSQEICLSHGESS